MKRLYIRKSIILLLIIINILILNETVSFAHETTKNHILILNSYHKGYSWTDNIVKGIESILKDDDNVIRIEYMDTKIIKDEQHLNNLYELYKHKFSNKKFDVIIATDNDAYNFLKQYHEKLFKDTPVICCGLDIFDDFITNRDNMFTGIAETIDVKDTINIASKLHSNIKNVIVTADNSLSGDMDIEIVKKVVPIYEGKIKFDFIQNDSIDYVVENLKRIPEDSIILQVGIYKDKFGEPIKVEKGNTIIAQTVDVPIYSCWEMNIGNGVLGGKMTSGYYQGETAAKMALQTLNGQLVSDIPFVQKSTNKYIFDYASMKKYKIKESKLPKNSVISNRPISFFKIQKRLMYCYIVLVVAILIFVNCALYKNILKLRKAEKQIIKDKETLQSILDSTADGILVVDNDWNVIHSNNRFGHMWRIPKALLITKNEKEMIDYVKEQLIEPDEFVNDIRKRSKTLKNNIDAIDFKDGRVFERLFHPLIIEGKANGMVWSFRDITKKRELEQLEREIEIKERLLEEANKYDKMKDQFLATISHELKTPLNIILGTIQLIDRTFCQEKCCSNYDKLKKYENISKQNCYRLLKLINNLIDITKIDSGFMNVHIRNENIVSVIENITLSIAQYIESKGITLIFDTEIEERTLACDGEKLERVMLNLFSNAVKFTEPGGSINVNIYDREECIIISVKDTGIGIPEDMKEKIFDRFKQVDSSLHRNAEGSGIGLSLVKSIVELHNGAITLESEVGKGSEFIIEIPVSLVDEKIDAQDEVASAAIQSNVERISIELSDIYSK